MTIDQWRQVKELFEASLEREPSARAQFIAEQSGGDDAIRQAAEQMLRDFDESGDFLEAPALVEFGFDGAQFDPGYEQGRRIGPYRIVSEIGQGGMGAVYLAERADDAYEKRVAIKMVWPGGIRSEINRRFNIERRVLAALDHPNIARLLDGGVTEDGWSYVVMEYVDGAPITTYCEQRKLSVAERLRLFQSVCEAVQYAHQNLIVHRDLKPSNILVTHAGEVKLLDFGIAKILDPTDDAAGQSQTLLNFLTPEYASPEHISGQRITTASDVYSLGVLLYELLTGARPFNPTSRSPQELIRLIEAHEPARPSLVSAPLDESIRKQLRGDLDNILLKALQKEPLRRYQSARQFSEDLTRHLNGAPVIAREATLAYRLGKFTRRHKTQIGAALLVMATLISMVTRETQLRRRAEAENRIQRRQLYSAQMQRAWQDWQEGHLAGMRETLVEWRPQEGLEDLRGFEWRHLWRLLNSESLKIEGPGRLNAMALSPDGRMVAMGMKSGTVMLYDAQTGERIAALSGHQEIIRGIAFSPEGRLLITGDALGVTRLWEIATKRERLQVGGHGKNIIHAVAFSPDGKTFATGGRDGVAKLWDAATGKEQVVFRSNSEGVRALVFSPDGRTVFTGSDDTFIRYWDVATGKERKVLKAFLTDVVSLAVTPDGRHLVASGADPQINMWEVATGKIVRTFAGHTDFVWKVVVSPDGKTLASGSVDRTARLWEIASGQELDRIKGHDEDVSFLAFTPDGRQLITGDSLSLKLWKISELPRNQIFRTSTRCRLQALALSSDGKLLAMGEDASGPPCKPPAVISLWEVESAKIKLKIPHERGLTGVGFLALRNHLVYSDITGLAGVVEIGTGREIAQFLGHRTTTINRKGFGDQIQALAVAPNGRLIATGSERNTVKLWTPDGGEVRTLRAPGETTEAGGHIVHALAFSHNGSRLAVGGYDDGVPLFDPASGQKLLVLDGHKGTILAIEFSPDDRLIATAGEDSLVKVWDATDGRLIRTLKGHADQVTCLAWTPDGQRLASAGKDRTIRFWNVETGLEVLALKEHTDAVTALAFSGDGHRLFSVSWDGTVRIWRAATEDEVRALPVNR